MSAPHLLSELVVAAADRGPDAPAVRSADGSRTYGQLAEATAQLASALQGLDVRRGDRVGVYVHKSVAAYTAVHGVLRSGAGYVPIDPNAPPGVVADIVRDCGIEVLVTEARQLPVVRQLPSLAPSLRAAVGLEADLPGLTTLSSGDVAGCGPPRPVKVLSEDLAYVMYTSGSTGRPKGIVHTHRSGLRYAEQAVDVYGVRPDDRLANSAPLHFDISTFELFAGPLAGASTLVIPEPHLKLPASLSQLVADDRSTFWYSVPFLLTELLVRGALEERDLSSLRWVLFGGEVMPPEVVAGLMAHLPNARFSNSYGPAEVNQCTVHVLAGPPPTDAPIPIGQPLPDAELRLVGDDGRLVEGDGPGELLVRCSTMMDRYWARPDLDARAFTRTELPGGGQARWYRTGDLVRRRADGDYEFVGRRDHQVKVRGNRVELEAVESVLTGVEGIEAAVAGVVELEGTSALAAAVLLAPGATVDVADALQVAAAALPPYAVPFRLLPMEDLPLTPSGKVDRRAVRGRIAAVLASGADRPVTHGGTPT